MKNVVVFDFDGTIIKCDSFWGLLRQGLLHEPWRLPLLLPLCFFGFIFLILLGGEHRPFKSAVLWGLTVGKSAKEAIRFLQSLVAETVNHQVREEIVTKGQRHLISNSKVIVATASSATWVRPVLKKAGFPYHHIVGSRLHWFWGGICMKGRNCFQTQKPLRISRNLGIDRYDYVYTDHLDDLSLIRRSREYEIV